MSEHTPGPWMVQRYVTGNGIASHVGTVGGGLVASVGDHDARCGGLHTQFASSNYEGLDRLKVLEANAALIADAPRLARLAAAGEELVKVVKDALPLIESGVELWEKGIDRAGKRTRAAIARYEAASKEADDARTS